MKSQKQRNTLETHMDEARSGRKKERDRANSSSKRE